MIQCCWRDTDFPSMIRIARGAQNFKPVFFWLLRKKQPKGHDFSFGFFLIITWNPSSKVSFNFPPQKNDVWLLWHTDALANQPNFSLSLSLPLKSCWPYDQVLIFLVNQIVTHYHHCLLILFSWQVLKKLWRHLLSQKTSDGAEWIERRNKNYFIHDLLIHYPLLLYRSFTTMMMMMIVFWLVVGWMDDWPSDLIIIMEKNQVYQKDRVSSFPSMKLAWLPNGRVQQLQRSHQVKWWWWSINHCHVFVSFFWWWYEAIFQENVSRLRWDKMPFLGPEKKPEAQNASSFSRTHDSLVWTSYRSMDSPIFFSCPGAQVCTVS